jgi:hypothetical protein
MRSIIEKTFAKYNFYTQCDEINNLFTGAPATYKMWAETD